MRVFACPSCGAELKFLAPGSVFGVCSFCKSTLVRRDVDIESIGKMAELPPDISPLQIGSHGIYNNQQFEVVGRVKVGWEDGIWNEWYCYFQNGGTGWLAEAQGFFAMCMPVEAALVPPLDSLQIGIKVSFGKYGAYSTDDIKVTTCIGSEGELPVSATQNKTGTTVDFTGPSGQFGSAEYSGTETRLFIGTYQTLRELQAKNLREIEGWPKWTG